MLIQVQEVMPTVERFMALLYHRTLNCLSTNECRRKLFCQERGINNTPPTSTVKNPTNTIGLGIEIRK